MRIPPFYVEGRVDRFTIKENWLLHVHTSTDKLRLLQNLVDQCQSRRIVSQSWPCRRMQRRHEAKGKTLADHQHVLTPPRRACLLAHTSLVPVRATDPRGLRTQYTKESAS